MVAMVSSCGKIRARERGGERVGPKIGMALVERKSVLRHVASF